MTTLDDVIQERLEKKMYEFMVKDGYTTYYHSYIKTQLQFSEEDIEKASIGLENKGLIFSGSRISRCYILTQ